MSYNTIEYLESIIFVEENGSLSIIIIFLLLFIFICLFCLLRHGFLYNSSACPVTLQDQGTLKLTEICLFLPPKCWGKAMCNHTKLLFFFWKPLFVRFTLKCKRYFKHFILKQHLHWLGERVTDTQRHRNGTANSQPWYLSVPGHQQRVPIMSVIRLISCLFLDCSKFTI